MVLVALPHRARTSEGMSSDNMPLAFTAETELARPVIRWLDAGRTDTTVAEEVDAGVGIADLVAGRRRDDVGERAPVTDPLQLRLLEMAQTPVSEADLRTWAPHGWRALRRRAVAPLLASGRLGCSSHEGIRRYRAAGAVDDPHLGLVAVELKLIDWRRAVAQAGRYRLFADEAYIAVPAHRVTDPVIAEARRNNVGVLAVTAGGMVEAALSAVCMPPLQPGRRRWVSEQVFASATYPSLRRAGAPLV